MRKLGKNWSRLITILSIALVAFHFITAGFGILSDLLQRTIHLAVVLPMCFLLKPVSKKHAGEQTIPFYDIIFAILSFCACAYIWLYYEEILWKPLRWYGALDKVFAIVLVLLILEASRRCVGPTFSIMAVAFFIYAIFGPYFPGTWGHQAFTVDVILQNLYHATTGIWGTMVGISSTMLAMFAIFGAVLGQTGGADTFIQIGLRLTGKSVGGPGKVAVVASGLMGMISGSSMANVLSTGVFTIPLMKKSGFPDHWAAAIEAVASTGGQIMPPIMGSAAFIMAQMLGIDYLTIAIAAIIPALLYYSGCFITVHYVAKRENIRGVNDRRRITVSDLIIIFVPIIIFVFFLARGYSVINSAFWATCTSLFVTFTVKLVVGRSASASLKKSGEIIAHSTMSGATSILDMAALLAGAQITVAMISLTGFGVKLSDLIISIGQNNLFLCLFLTMVVCILLGMGLPTTAAYVLAVAVLVPALTKLGLEAFVAHMFVFYFSCLATITPPVCAAVFLASNVAQSNWVKTGFTACGLALAGFIVPYTFAYNPCMLMQGSPLDILYNTAVAFIGIYSISIGASGYLNHKLHPVTRALAILGGIAMVIPETFTDLIGILVLAVIFVIDWRYRKAHAAELAAAHAKQGDLVELGEEELQTLEHIDQLVEQYELETE